jgi:hypothetical protein
MKWHVPKIWEGKTCWIIGGGPSMPRQFDVPEEVIKDVMSGKDSPSVYSAYLAPLHNEHIIGVNNAYQIGTWVDVVFFGDCDWYLTHRTRLSEFPGLKVTCCPRFENYRNSKAADGLLFLAKDSSKKFGISDDKTKVSWNANSGAAAISLAAHLGVKRIVLLGFDMRLDPNNCSHWHGAHGKVIGKKFKTPFDRHLAGFSDIANDATRLGIEIINASPESAISVFKKMSVKELLCEQQSLKN